MSDTAQPGLAAENVQLEEAADAFKTFITNESEPARPRDESGRFVPAARAEGAEAPEPEVDDDPLRGELPTATEEEVEVEETDDQDDVEEAAEEAQPEPVAMPSSWSNDDADLWNALPPEAQAKLATREGQRETAVNQKFQEVANARKAAEAQLSEANANRDRFAAAIDQVLSLGEPSEPDPFQYGLGSGNFNSEAFQIAQIEYRQLAQHTEQLRQQREQIAAQQAEEAEWARVNAHQEIEATAWPAFLADVPELADPVKGKQIINEIIDHVKSRGVPSQIFDDPEQAKSLTSIELHLAWEAMQYRKEKAARARLQAKNPPPKPASPAIKPGTVATRTSVNKQQLTKAQDRLARDGSVESGAAVFKHLFKESYR